MPPIPAELPEQLVPGPVTPAQLDDVFQRFKAFVERALSAEMIQHLDYEAGQLKPEDGTNHRNGKSEKTALTDTGAPGRQGAAGSTGQFRAAAHRQAREGGLTGFDDKIMAMYARGMAVRQIRCYLGEMYSVDVSSEHQQGHRRRHERGHRLAGAAAGADVFGGVLRRLEGEDWRVRRGAAA